MIYGSQSAEKRICCSFSDYFRYFTAFIYQFQFHRAMCLAAGKMKNEDIRYSNHCTVRAVCEGGP